MVDLQTEAAFLLLAACCSEAGGLVLAPLQSSHGAVRIWPCTAVAMAWHNAALRLLCGRGWQTPQPPPGAGGGASRPVRAAEARAGARARGDETSLQPSPARNRAGGWCDMSRTRPRASSPFDLMLTRWLAPAEPCWGYLPQEMGCSQGRESAYRAGQTAGYQTQAGAHLRG